MYIIHKMCALVLMCVLILCPLASAQALHTRDEIRARYMSCVSYEGASPYAQAPVVSKSYSPGCLTEEAESAALSYLNFLRYLAYLESEVALDPLYSLRAQHGAVLLAANDKLAHDSPCPQDMPGDFYLTAHAGTMSSNIACINWMEDSILLTAVEFFVRDDGAENLDSLGHRRWLLDPRMAYTGFGLANSETGMSYAVMYAHDASVEAQSWDNVKWPSEGAFPADLMTDGLAWSVSLDPSVYDVASSDITVTMSERSAGGVPVKYFRVDTSGYGAGPCVIFMPELDLSGIGEYRQNQIWDIVIDGLVDKKGNDTRLSYTVEMIALYPIDPVNVEISDESLELAAGDQRSISAEVIPQWADDVSVIWTSSDESVAVVENGVITACASGECTITALSVNGRSAVCNVIVR